MKKKFYLFTLTCILFILFHDFHASALMVKLNSKPDYIIFIDVYSFTLSVVNKENGECIKSYPVAIGKKDTPSPIGTWQIKSKALMDGPFGGYWLGLNAPWDTFGIHGTSNPSSIGSMASNGCIRLYNWDIKELFNLIEYDTSVIIFGGDNWLFSPYNRVILPNQKGSDVYHIQRILNGLGYYPYEADGIYGYALELAVLEYKEEHNLDDGPAIDNEFLKSIGCIKFE